MASVRFFHQLIKETLRATDPPVAKLDLTLREVQEAKSYGLSPDQYDELRSKLEDRLKKKVFPEAEKVKADYIESVRKEVRKDLTPKIREEVLGECRKQARAELWDELWKKAKDEVSSRAPNPKEREAFVEFVREAELDCLTQAHAASVDADKSRDAYQWNRRLRYPFAWALFLAAPVLAFILHGKYEWGLGFWAYLVPLILGAIGFAYHTNEKDSKLEPRQAAFGKVASDYWVLAEKAKKLRIVTTNTALNRGELQTSLQEFAQEKRNLDDRYLPSAKLLEKARVEIRSQLLQEIDPEKVFRIASDKNEEFEALEQAEAKAEAKQA